jgi:hypothetical protein
MARNNQRSRNNNPSGRNQYSGGVMDMARDRPFAAAGMAAAAVGAGVFLWSKRNQISEQISNLSDQFSEWSQNMGSGSSDFAEDDTAGLTTGKSRSGNRKSQSEISEEALTLKETGSQRNKAGGTG